MDIDRSAPATADGEIDIAADPVTVFSVIATIAEWSAWNPDVKAVSVAGEVRAGTEFTWKAGGVTLKSTVQLVDPPHEIGWTGTTMGIHAVHVFRLEPCEGGTLVRSEESWDGVVARLLKSYSRRTIKAAITSVLAHLKTEAERRAAAASPNS